MYELNASEIGKELIDAKIISQEDFEKILFGVKKGKAFDQLVLDQEGVSESIFFQTVAKILKLPFIEVTDYRIDPEVVQLISARTAKEFCVFPLFKIHKNLVVAMVDPSHVLALDQIRQESGFEPDPVIGSRSEILKMVDQYYGAHHSMGTLVENLQRGEEIKEVPVIPLETLTLGENQPAVQLLNLLIEHAVKEGASDIHIEPELDRLRVRIRVDGVLHEVPAPPKKYENILISRAKIMADLNIAESRVPQDGRFSTQVDRKRIDVRVSTMPTVHGENIVLRILDAKALQIHLQELGFSSGIYQRFECLIKKPYGMILVTGPTGSGKTTTLYAALRSINSLEKNIVTIEDPVEYKLEIVRQIQVNPKVGLTFASGLRSIVRQDPNIIMVGEIRDSETAGIATQSALTGHLVFSTLHTNDAAGAAVRLIEMGVEPFLVSSSVIGIVAQRLVRLTCEKCKKTESLSQKVLQMYQLEGSSPMKGAGCRFCRHTGFKGRMGIFELLELNDNIRQLVSSKVAASEIKKKAIESGMKTMLQDGLEKVRQGKTSLDEVLRVAEIGK
ncbi:MAG: type II/IV secretion system protein [Chlamydiae bacterium]|nr:type II/IV secretion system protein [Chlamydiota bacterium]MBI3276699.1 type II/IV secretion system protein [Chlamydiota bacterium]